MRSSISSQDATWISTTNTLKCNSPSDIFLLLKSSDFIAHDLDHAFEECYYEGEDVSRKLPSDEFELVLRKWYDYDVAPSMEFRCFVKDNEIVGTYINSREHFKKKVSDWRGVVPFWHFCYLLNGKASQKGICLQDICGTGRTKELLAQVNFQLLCTDNNR